MNRYFVLILVCLVSLSSIDSYGQKKRKRAFHPIGYINSIQLTGGIGTSTYFGDLCDNRDCMRFRPNAGIGLIYRYSPRLLFRSEVYWAQLYATDEGGKNPIRNLHFKNNIYEWNIQGIMDMYPYERKYAYRQAFTPYGFAGIAVFYNNPKAKLGNRWVRLSPLKTEGQNYSKIIVSVPYGFGVRYKASDKLNISFEAGYRWTFTDYIDDVSNVYVDNSTLSADAKILADRTNEQTVSTVNNVEYINNNWIAGHVRGNPKRNDGYFIFGVKAEYRLKYTSQGFTLFRRAKFSR